MQLLITFARAYPWQSAWVLLALVLGGLIEGLGLTALLPLLNLVIDDGTAASSTLAEAPPENSSGPEHLVTQTLLRFGLEPTLGALLVVIVVSITTKSGLVLLANKQVGYTVAHVATDLRLALLRALLTSRWEYFIRQPVGSLANAMGTEAYRSSEAYLFGATLMALLVEATAYSVVALLVAWKATIICLLAWFSLLYLLNGLVRWARRAGKRQTKLLKSLLSRLADSMVSVKPIKAMAREKFMGSLLEGETKRLNKALERQVFSKEAMRALQEPILVCMVAIGLYLALTHWGLPLATVMVLVLLLAGVLEKLGKMQRQYQKMVICESAYWSLLRTIRSAERDREANPGRNPPRLNQGIHLKRVCFAYGDNEVLRDASLTIPAGALTTLTGASGTGKTTVLDLIIGLLQPRQGQIWIDELPLEQIDLQRWRRMIGYVPQETLLLHDTILNNVALGDPELEAAEVERALRAVEAWEFVAALPEGMHSTVGERGTKLSGGQRQRVAIARALVHKPRLLILDEATSALDPDAEAAICKTLQKLGDELTILAISHQQALVNTADRVYRLQDKKAVLAVDRAAAASHARAAELGA
jgi:ATP-binding cassette subfamily C protein